MNRLTKYSHGVARVDSSHTISLAMGEYIGESIDRLAAYEDSGLTPEEVQRLAKDKENLRPHGRWEEKIISVFVDDSGKPEGADRIRYRCSNCGCSNEEDSFYCPACGATMETFGGIKLMTDKEIEAAEAMRDILKRIGER